MTLSRKSFIGGSIALSILPSIKRQKTNKLETLTFRNGNYEFTFSNLSVFEKYGLTTQKLENYSKNLITLKEFKSYPFEESFRFSYISDILSTLKVYTDYGISINLLCKCRECMNIPKSNSIWLPLPLKLMYFADNIICYSCNTLIKNRPLDKPTNCSLQLKRYYS